MSLQMNCDFEALEDLDYTGRAFLFWSFLKASPHLFELFRIYCNTVSLRSSRNVLLTMKLFWVNLSFKKKKSVLWILRTWMSNTIRRLQKQPTERERNGQRMQYGWVAAEQNSRVSVNKNPAITSLQAQRRRLTFFSSCGVSLPPPRSDFDGKLWKWVQYFWDAAGRFQGKHRKSKGPRRGQEECSLCCNSSTLSFFTRSHHKFFFLHVIFYITCIFTSCYSIIWLHIYFDPYSLHSLVDLYWILGIFYHPFFFKRNACCLLKYVSRVLCMLTEKLTAPFSSWNLIIFSLMAQILLYCYFIKVFHHVSKVNLLYVDSFRQSLKTSAKKALDHNAF